MPGGPAGLGPGIPEEALLGVDVADDWVSLVGVRGGELGGLARQVFKLHADRHLVGVRLADRRHDALDAVVGFTARREGGLASLVSEGRAGGVILDFLALRQNVICGGQLSHERVEGGGGGGRALGVSVREWAITHSVMLHSSVLLTTTLTFEPMSKCSPKMDTLVPPERGPLPGSM